MPSNKTPSTSAGADTASSVVFKKRRSRPIPAATKRPATEEESSSSDSSNSDGNTLPQKRRRTQTVHASSRISTIPSSDHIIPTTHHADRENPIAESNDATRTSNIQNHTDRGRIGPAKTSANVRVTAMTDYRPDICKDYKKTGWCGYGDACIYAHDRGYYQQGWQLNQDWEKTTKKSGCAIFGGSRKTCILSLLSHES